MLRRLFAEGLGMAWLLSIVVGSGIMAERLSGGNGALALLVNSSVIGAGLVVLITIFAPVSGAHFNPVVTLLLVIRREISLPLALAYGVVQCVGAVLGVWLAHVMFAVPIIQFSSHARDGMALWIAEGVAAMGLILTITGTLKYKPDQIAANVGLYIFAACWFTASSTFVNPAVTLARSLTDSYCGIAPHSLPGFLLAQVVGSSLGYAASRLLGFEPSTHKEAA